jgi:hypothetical protein
MARLLINVTTPAATSVAAFEAAMNAVLAPLTSHLIGGWDAQTTGALPAYVREFRGILDVATGGTVIATPYQVKAIEAQSDTQAAALATAFIAANPLAFFAPGLYRYTDQLPNITNRSIYFLLTNSVLANGQANWAPGYVVAGASGPAGGDLGGTYPNPTVVKWRSQPLDPITMAAPALNNVPQWDGTKWVAGAAPSSPINTGLTVWVDSVFGNDATGLRQRQDKPFLTVAAACAAASSGDLVYVRPGTYAETVAWSKNGVTVFMPAGVLINYSVFLISNPGTFTILGQGDLQGAAGSRLVNVSVASQNIQLTFRDLGVTGGGGTAVFQLNSAGNFIKVRCRNINAAIDANVVFSYGNTWAINGNTLDVWADENMGNTSGTGLGFAQVRGNFPTYRFACGRTMFSTAGNVIDTTFAGGNAPLFLQADTFSAPGGLIGTSALGATAALTVSGRIISASSGAGVNWPSAGSISLQGFSFISGVTAGLNITAGTVSVVGGPTVISASGGPGITLATGSISGAFMSVSGTTFGITAASGSLNLQSTAPDVAASAGVGVSISGATLLGEIGAVTGSTIGLQVTSGTVQLEACGFILGNGGNGITMSGGTVFLGGFNTIRGSTNGIAMTGGTLNAFGNTVQGTNNSAVSCTGVVPILKLIANNVAGAASTILVGATVADVEVTARRLTAVGTAAIDITSGGGVTTINSLQISVSAGDAPALRMTGGTSTVRVFGARLLGVGTGPAVQRDIATGKLVLQGCALIAGGTATNSITAAVPTNVVLNTPTSANLVEAANVTTQVNALNVNVNVG